MDRVAESESVNHMTDEELMALARNGEQAAFAELMLRTSSSSFKLALSILKDHQEAEDEVQNSYWNAWRFVGQFQGESKFSTWLSRIVINQCLMRLRQARKATILYLDDGVPGGNMASWEVADLRPTPEMELARRELSAILHREIRRLPPLLRGVLTMRDLEERAMEDIAGQLGISVMAAKSRLLRARIELRHRMEKYGRGALAEDWTLAVARDSCDRESDPAGL